MTPLALEWVQKAEEDFEVARWMAEGPTASFNAICFHSQQCVEKYLKARLAEACIPFPKTHDLGVLLDLVTPVEPTWASTRAELEFLKPFSTETRYPGVSASAEDAVDALQVCTAVRKLMRDSMGLI